MLIYKLFRGPEWADLQAAGETRGAPVDVADGYVHFSTAAQVRETAEKWFAGVADLWLLSVDSEGLGTDLRWEPSRGGALFPHLYRSLRMRDVIAAQQVPLVDGAHRFPDLA